jgi:hypothetical protein
MEAYVQTMAQNVDTTQPFILVGYSFGAIIMQEMNRLVTPKKNIVISSVKNENEFPLFIRFGRKIFLAKYIPEFTVNDTIAHFFAHWIYDMTPEEINKYVAYTSPTYVKWVIYQTCIWKSQNSCKNFFHIHGSKDQIFPIKLIKNVYAIENGDHLMVIKKTEDVNNVLNHILLA